MKKTIPAYRLALLALPLSSSTLPLPVCLAAASTAGLATLTSCVTVNVNFPESAAQKATDDYVRDLYRARERSKTSTATTSFFKTLKQFSLIPAVHAAEEESFRLDSSKTASIKEKLKARVDEVITYKRSGVLGESSQGKLVLKDPSKLKTLQKSRVETLVQEENAIRDDLYEEVLKINKLPSTRLNNIQSSFARSFQAESPSGTWLESPDGRWAQKP